MKLRSKRTQREWKIVLRVQTERADRLGALDLKRWKRPQSFCHRLHLVRKGGGLYVRGIMRCTEKNKMTTTWAESACGRIKYGYGFH